MKKITVLTAVLFLCMFQLTFGEAKLKVAVLDATIGNGVEENASAIVADTINEQFVKSGKYIAIDRAYISKIQAEKKFQLSGEVNSDDVKELGALFGAQFICVANVSKLGSTYTVSARMIDVTTAQVVSQESAKQKGEVDVLFDVAEEVGTKLVGKHQVSPQPVKESKAPEKKSTTEKKTAAPSKPSEKGQPRSRITVGYMFPGYLGNKNDPPIYNIFSLLYSATSGSFYDASTDTIYTASDGWVNSWGLDIESLIHFGSWYFSAGFRYTEQVMGYTDSTNTDNEFTNFYTIEPYIGAGGIFPIIRNLQLYGGLSIGYLMLTIGDYWPNEGDNAGGFSYGIEVGADYFIGSICVSVKYKLSYSGDLTGDNIFTDSAVDSGYDTSFGTSGLVLSAGYGF